MIYAQRIVALTHFQPRRIKEIGPRIKKVTDELTNELERSPSITEIADHDI
jgi:DNA-directed RNA polymerase specialized sigma subunit